MHQIMELLPDYHTYTITVNKYSVVFRCKFKTGSSDALLFFHGLACSWDSFKNVLDKDYFPDKSLLFVDHIGFGESSKPNDFSYTMQDQAKIIDELLSILPNWNIHIVAHSMGAAIALHLKPKPYKRILSFSNIEGNLIREDCGIMSRSIAKKTFEDYKNSLHKMHLFAFSKHEQLHFKQSTPFAIYQSAVSLVKESDSGDLLEKFKQIPCKKAYFYGEENKAMPILEKLNFAQKFMISNSGHAMTTDNPDEFYAKLADFLDF